MPITHRPQLSLTSLGSSPASSSARTVSTVAQAAAPASAVSRPGPQLWKSARAASSTSEEVTSQIALGYKHYMTAMYVL